MSVGNYQGTYAAEKVIVTIGGIIVSGWADGDFVTAEYDEDRYMKKTGADGEVARSKNASRAGKIEIILAGTSKANDELSSACGLPVIGGVDQVLSISVADLSGRTVISASKAWLKTAPKVSFGKEINDRNWMFDCADLSMNIGGNGF